MRARLVLIAIAFAVLAFAGLRHDDARTTEARHGIDAASALAAQPAPDAEPPAIVRAAVTASATAQTHVAGASRGHVHPAPHVSAASGQTRSEPGYDFSRPRAFPLLI